MSEFSFEIKIFVDPLAGRREDGLWSPQCDAWFVLGENILFAYFPSYTSSKGQKMDWRVIPAGLDMEWKSNVRDRFRSLLFYAIFQFSA